jgi:hypothetical protein
MTQVLTVIKSLKDDPPIKYDADTARAIRLHLERLACKIERTQANPAYQYAFRIIAKLIRESKPD